MNTPPHFDPLHDPAQTPRGPFSLDIEIAVTRQILEETASLNIHDDNDMRSAAFSLNCRLRQLLAAIDAERGEGQ